SVSVAVLAVAAWSGRDAVARPFTDPRSERIEALEASAAFASEPLDPACQATTLVAAGRAAPRNPRTLAVRWIGFPKFELAYNGRVILLDAYHDRGSIFPPPRVQSADRTKADLPP